jgi:DNA helicase IV
VLGDIAQGTTPWAATSWPTLLSHLGKPAASVRELDVGYRVPRQILDFASRLLPAIAPDLSPAKSLRADPNALALVPVPSGELGERVAQGCVAALAGLGSVAVICADADVQATAQALRSAGLAFTVLGADGGVLGAGGSVPDSDRTGQSEISETADRLTLVPVTLAKGLEFDHVVLVEPGRIATGEAYGLRRLYVALTRAVSRLTVFHAEPLPAELSLHTIRAAFELGPFRGRRPPRASQPGVRVL